MAKKIFYGVPNKVKRLTKKYMNIYNMGLFDAFNDAVRELKSDRNSELYKAWYYQDFRKFIPSAYIPEYLDFKKYPLKYN